MALVFRGHVLDICIFQDPAAIQKNKKKSSGHKKKKSSWILLNTRITLPTHQHLRLSTHARTAARYRRGRVGCRFPSGCQAAGTGLCLAHAITQPGALPTRGVDTASDHSCLRAPVTLMQPHTWCRLLRAIIPILTVHTHPPPPRRSHFCCLYSVDWVPESSPVKLKNKESSSFMFKVSTRSASSASHRLLQAVFNVLCFILSGLTSVKLL